MDGTTKPLGYILHLKLLQGTLAPLFTPGLSAFPERRRGTFAELGTVDASHAT
jgi:hypothetical protein